MRKTQILNPEGKLNFSLNGRKGKNNSLKKGKHLKSQTWNNKSQVKQRERAEVPRRGSPPY